jgi:hypothetical protein
LDQEYEDRRGNTIIHYARSGIALLGQLRSFIADAFSVPSTNTWVNKAVRIRMVVRSTETARRARPRALHTCKSRSRVATVYQGFARVESSVSDTESRCGQETHEVRGRLDLVEAKDPVRVHRSQLLITDGSHRPESRLGRRQGSRMCVRRS